MNRSAHIYPLKTQQGAVLIMGLLILLVVTLIGISSMNTSTMEHRITGNLLDSQSAFQAAESALQIGEMWVLLQADPLDADGVNASLCSPKPCAVYNEDTLLTATGKDSFAQMALDPAWETWAIEYIPAGDGTKDLNNVESYPSYVRELMGTVDIGSLVLPKQYVPNDKQYFYRVTAKGTGKSDMAAVVLQSVVSITYN